MPTEFSAALLELVAAFAFLVLKHALGRCAPKILWVEPIANLSGSVSFALGFLKTIFNLSFVFRRGYIIRLVIKWGPLLSLRRDIFQRIRQNQIHRFVFRTILVCRNRFFKLVTFFLFWERKLILFVENALLIKINLQLLTFDRCNDILIYIWHRLVHFAPVNHLNSGLKWLLGGGPLPHLRVSAA